MPVESSFNYPSDLNSAWPLGSDGKNYGPSHLRGIKSVIKTTVPNVNGVITLTDEQINALVNVPGVNLLDNGDFRVAQRGTSFTSATTFTNNDTNYTLDRWKLFTDGNDIFDVTQETDATTGETFIRLDVETINKKGGIFQLIEQRQAARFIGETVTFSFQAKVTSTTKLDNIKAAIISWSGTADSVTADLISAWNVEGTNPTLIANATYENTPANLGVTTSWATYSVSGLIDTASAKNIGVFIWSDVTDTTLGEFIEIRRAKLEWGSIATPFVAPNYQASLASCQRFLPAFNGTISGFGASFTTSAAQIAFPLPVPARASVTGVTLSNASDFDITNAAGSNAVTSASLSYQSALAPTLLFNVSGTPFTAGHGARLTANTASARIVLTGAEL